MSSKNDLEEVVIGTQIWTAKNLNVNTFRNGDIIPQAKTNEEWIKVNKEEKPACCYYENIFENGINYGMLYNWFAVNDLRGLAPSGWHVSIEAEWNALIEYLGGGGNALVKKLKSKKGWNAIEGKSGNGTNKSGFDALPGGYRFVDAVDGGLGYEGSWWTSSDAGGKFAWAFSLHFSAGFNNTCLKSMGFSVRCIKD